MSDPKGETPPATRLAPLFAPRGIAVAGASPRPGQAGGGDAAIAELPVTKVGKLDKKALREMLAGRGTG